MKRKQITAILLSAIMAVSACMPMNGISAVAAEAAEENAAAVEMLDEEAPDEEALNDGASVEEVTVDEVTADVAEETSEAEEAENSDGRDDAAEAEPEEAVTGTEQEEAAYEQAPKTAERSAQEQTDAVQEQTDAEQDQKDSAQIPVSQDVPEEEVIIESNGVPLYTTRPAVYSNEPLAGSEKTYSSLSEVLDYVQSRMIARQETISVTVTEGVLNQLDLEHYTDISAHTGDPCGGDYLRSTITFTWASWSTTWDGDYEIEYNLSYKTSVSEEAEADAEVNRLISALGLKDGSKSDYDKVKAIHDYIVENVEYDYDTYYYGTNDYPETYTGYGAIVKHLAVCQGFASMFYRLCLEAGIDARIIDSNELGHAWNIVQMDGLYYLMDCTWDENTDSDDYFLRGRHDFGEHSNSDDQYQDAAFAKRYPLSDYKYGFEIKSLGTAPDYTLITQDGRVVSTAAQNGRAKVLIFFLEGCGRFLYTVNSLSGKEYDGVDFLYVNMVDYSTEEQQNILAQIGDEMPEDVPGSYVLCSNGSDARAEFEDITGLDDHSGYVYSASVFLIDPDNQILYAENAYAGEIGTLVEAMLEDSDLPSVPEPGEDPYAGFTEIGLCGKNAVWRFYGEDGGACEKGTLLITGKGDLWDNYYYYTPIGWLSGELTEERSFSGENIQASDVQRVIIEDGITHIGESDFSGFTSLASITFKGAAPTISSGHGVTRSIRIYYPEDDASWNKVDKGLFSKSTKWISQDADGVHHHKWGSSTVTKKPTCTEEGLQVGTCTECGEKASEAIPALGHKWASTYSVDQAATCTAEGSESIHCTMCGEVKEGSARSIEKTAHTYGNWTIVTAASCELPGLRKKVCTACGDEVREVIPAAGHKWASTYSVDVAATRTSEGSESIHCTVCDAIKEGSQRVIPMVTQEPQVITVKPAAASVVVGKTVDITVTGARGALSCEVGDRSMATVSVSGSKITVKGVKAGTVKIIVKAAETADYEAGEAVVDLTILPGKTTRGDMFNLANNVKVTWYAVPGAKYYKVYREGVTDKRESLKEPVIVTAGLVGWDKSPGLTNGHAYRYRIVASLTGAGDSSGDSPLSYSKLMYRLKTVVIRSVKNTAPGKVTVKYDKSTSGDSYVLQYCEREDMVGAKTKVVLGANNTSYVIGGLKKGKTYYISIRVRKKVSGIDYYTTFGVAKKVKIVQ